MFKKKKPGMSGFQFLIPVLLRQEARDEFEANLSYRVPSQKGRGCGGQLKCCFQEVSKIFFSVYLWSMSWNSLRRPTRLA